MVGCAHDGHACAALSAGAHFISTGFLALSDCAALRLPQKLFVRAVVYGHFEAITRRIKSLCEVPFFRMWESAAAAALIRDAVVKRCLPQRASSMACAHTDHLHGFGCVLPGSQWAIRCSHRWASFTCCPAVL